MQIEDPQEVAEAVKLLANPRLICSAHAMQPHLRAFNSERESRAITAFLLARAGRSPLLRGAYAEAEALYQRSLALYRELGDRQGVAILLRLQGDVAIYQG